MFALITFQKTESNNPPDKTESDKDKNEIYYFKMKKKEVKSIITVK